MMWNDKDKNDEGETCMCFNAVAHARALNIVNELHGRWNGSPLTFFVRRESTTPLQVNYIPAAAVKKIISTLRTTRALFTESAVGYIVANYPYHNRMTKFVRAYKRAHIEWIPFMVMFLLT